MSSFAIERVLDEAKLHSGQWILMYWSRATRKHQEPLSSTPVISGFLVDERRGIKDRVAELKAICDVPYREPVDHAVVLDAHGRHYAPTPAQGTPTDPIPDPVLPVNPYYPGFYGYPYGRGYGPGYGYGYGWGGLEW